MFRRLLVPALIAALAAAAPATVAARAAAPTYLRCELPGKDGKPGGGGIIHMHIGKHGGMRDAVQACLAHGGHPAGVTDDAKK